MIRRLPFALITLVLLTLSSVIAASENNTRNLSGAWKFMPGDDIAWAEANWDDSKWQNQWVPESWPKNGYPEHNHFAWYRRSIDVTQFDTQDLGIRIGAIRNAYEIYINGEKVGAVGALPPNQKTTYDKLKVIRVPPNASLDNRLVIAIRVWGGTDLSIQKTGAGAYAEKFLVGNYTELVRTLDAEQIPKFIFASLFVLTGLYFLFLHFKTKAVPAFLWFGITAVMLALYIVTQTQWRYEWGLNFLNLEKIEAISFFLFLAGMIELIWSVIDRPTPTIMKIVQGLFVTLSVIYLFAPSLDVHYHLRAAWQILVVLSLGPVLWVIFKQMRLGNPDARYLFYGFTVFSLCGLNDLLVNINLHIDSGLRLMPFGFLAVLIAMGASLAGKFNLMLVSLEHQVAQRTHELSEVNQQLAAANNSLVEMTRIDPLTGLLNRRGLMAEAEIERQRFVRQREPLGLIIADIDHFKQFNDSYGHACGDAVLIAVAQEFRDHVRDIDRISRWGGEEFVLLFPGTDDNGLANIAEKLRQCIEAFKLAHEGQNLKVTMTFGGATYRANETIDDCIGRADKALYSGKSKGRNQVVIAS